MNYAVPAKERIIEKQAEKFFVMAGKRRLQCYAWGEGPVVLLVHGWAGRATQFRKMIPAFVAAGFRVVGFDGPAHGRSQGWSTDIDQFEVSLRAIYARVGIPQGVVAHSFGGSAVLYAATKGLPVHKLINIASPTIGDEIIATYLRRIGGSAETGQAFKRYILSETGKPFDHFTSQHFIRNVMQPLKLLLIHDDGDSEVGLTHATALTALYPAAELVKTSGLGHTRILRDEKVIEKCVSFLKS